jgi:hypothetical protein
VVAGHCQRSVTVRPLTIVDTFTGCPRDGCRTVIDSPSTCTNAVRGRGPGFAAAVMVSAPDPVPRESVTVSQSALELADHAAVGRAALTAMRRESPPASGVQADGVTVVIFSVRPACLMTHRSPEMVSIASRGIVS